jgi:hypothetical protein
MILLGIMVPKVTTQTSDLVASSYHTFNLLADVYRLGGAAPELVAKLNIALEQMQEARIKRAQGDEAGAARLEEQARSTIAEIENAIPAAQQRAERDSATRMLFVLASIPVAVIISTFTFYLALSTWRRYERLKLYEMRIVENKKSED